jgi:hypothetical protein
MPWRTYWALKPTSCIKVSSLNSQGRSAFIRSMPKRQGLQPIEQEVLDDREHLALDGGAVDLLQQGHDLNRLQEVKEVVQQRPFVQPVYAVHQLLTIEPPRDPRGIAPGDLPTQPFLRLWVISSCVCSMPHLPLSNALSL